MTEKLYYRDPFLRTFQAEVVEQQGHRLRLDRTAFYPTGGGQPCDTGTLNGIPVLDVEKGEEGEIWHTLAEPLELEASLVHGEINWARRFDHMQQHSGQHLLSAAFHRLFGGETIGFHLGERVVTIDLDLPRLSWEAATRVEDEVNRIIWEDRPIEARFVDEATLATLQLRRAPKVTGPIRVVAIEGYDVTPCGGTHVLRTGQIGLLKITAIERYKGGVRVSFLCGGRALRYYRHLQELMRQATATLTLGADELPAAVERLRDENRALQRELRRLRLEELEREAPRLWEAAPTLAGVKVISGHREGDDLDTLRRLAAILRQQPRTLLLLATTEAKGCRYLCARSDDLPLDAAALLKAATAPLGGRGGGSATLAQGGGPSQPPQSINSAFEEAIRRALHTLESEEAE